VACTSRLHSGRVVAHQKIANAANPLDVVGELTGATGAEVAVWSGKPDKGMRRVFIHTASGDRRWIAKAAIGADPGLEREYRALGALAHLVRGTALECSIPIEVQLRSSVLCQRVLPGATFSDDLRRSRYRPWIRSRIRERCLAAVRWLRAFHDLSGRGDSLTRRGRTHGDFKPANVLFDGLRIGVVDWELSSDDAVQADDLFHFLMYFGLACFAPDRMRGFVRTFMEPTWVSAIARACLREYCPEHPVSAARAAFDSYLGSTLERRASLGLANQGYFLTDVQRYFVSRASQAYLFTDHLS
jgi:hypothetical protein